MADSIQVDDLWADIEAAIHRLRGEQNADAAYQLANVALELAGVMADMETCTQ